MIQRHNEIAVERNNGVASRSDNRVAVASLKSDLTWLNFLASAAQNSD